MRFVLLPSRTPSYCGARAGQDRETLTLQQYRIKTIFLSLEKTINIVPIEISSIFINVFKRLGSGSRIVNLFHEQNYCNAHVNYR